jgi:type IV pilus assembly protein PilE
MMKTKLNGFTLIELMIAVSIVGILASIAIPNYRQYIVKAKRGEAEAALVTLANAMEQWRIQNNGSYLGAADINGSPAIFSTVVPISGGKTTYNLTISDATATTYTLKATPIAIGTQASDGYLSITSLGVKTCGVASACLNGTSW